VIDVAYDKDVPTDVITMLGEGPYEIDDLSIVITTESQDNLDGYGVATFVIKGRYYRPWK